VVGPASIVGQGRGKPGGGKGKGETSVTVTFRDEPGDKITSDGDPIYSNSNGVKAVLNKSGNLL